jgi:hypothetical protein
MNRVQWLSMLVLLCLMPAKALADERDLARETQFLEATAALKQGASSKAIDIYELMADHGFLHPDASFNRAVAYIKRAESPQARPGDLGRAAAALSEALLLRREDAAARDTLRLVREEIGRRRARQGAQQVSVSPSLTRAVVGLLSETAWAVLAALGSFMLTLGIAFRLWLSHTATRLASGVLTVLGASLLLTCGSLALAARHFRTTSRPAVVVVSEARLLDAKGNPLAQRATGTTIIPEGEQVTVVETEPARAMVEWGTTRGWVNRSQLQILKQ